MLYNVIVRITIQSDEKGSFDMAIGNRIATVMLYVSVAWLVVPMSPTGKYCTLSYRLLEFWGSWNFGNGILFCISICSAVCSII